MLKKFLESHALTFTRLCEATGKSWDVVLIEAGKSANRRFYPPAVLRAAISLFEGARCCAYRYGKKLDSDDDFNHLPDGEARQFPGGFAENTVGFFEKVRYGNFERPDGSTGEGLLARFQILEGAEWLRKNLRDAFNQGRSDILGFSIDAEGEAREAIVNGERVTLVERIAKVTSTDVVTTPAAGGSLLRLVASVTKEATVDLLEMLRRMRPHLLEGLAARTGTEAETAYLTRVLEAILGRVRRTWQETEASAPEFLEASSLMKAIEGAMQLLKAGKVQEAMSALRSMIAALTPDAAPAPAPAPAAPAAESTPGNPALVIPHTQTPPSGATPVQEAAASAAPSPEQLTNLYSQMQAREAALRVRERVSASGLKEEAQQRLIKMFEGKAPSNIEIDAQIESMRSFVSSFSESGRPMGLGSAQAVPRAIGGGHGGLTERRRMALEGMICNRDLKDAADNIVPRYTSFVEAYGELTNDWGPIRGMQRKMWNILSMALPQSFNDTPREHNQMLQESWPTICRTLRLNEQTTTTDIPFLVADVIQKRLQKEREQDPRNDWRKIVSNPRANLKDATSPMRIIRLGDVQDLQVVAQDGVYAELTPDPMVDEQETYTPSKLGGTKSFTWEDFLADNLQALAAIPKLLAQSANRVVFNAVWNIIESNQAIQGNNLISVANNNDLGVVALTGPNVIAARTVFRKQTSFGAGTRLGSPPKFLLTTIDQEGLAEEATGSEFKINATEDSTLINVIKRFKIEPFSTLGLGVTAPRENDWYLAGDPNQMDTIEVGFLGGRDTPEMFVQGQQTPTAGLFFDRDRVRFKVRYVFGVGLLDFRWIVGNRI
jgi:hypothetical protein